MVVEELVGVTVVVVVVDVGGSMKDRDGTSKTYEIPGSVSMSSCGPVDSALMLVIRAGPVRIGVNTVS